jgi:hypothetical protein
MGDEPGRHALAMSSLAVVALSLVALATLCLAMPRHRARVWVGERRTAVSAALRSAGSAALAAGAVVAMFAQGVGVGLVLWCGALTLAALCVVLCLSYRPLWLVRLAAISAAFGIAAVALSYGV